MKAIRFALATLLGSCAVFAQSAPFAITGIQRNADNTVSFTWNSMPGKWYQLEYSPDLQTWHTLNELVVSQGATSMSSDAGRYDLTPKIKRPFSSGEARRFWRAREIGENEGTPPTVSITTPSANDTVSGIITVSVTTSGPNAVNIISLYVDGEMIAEESGPDADFSINTSEWANGPHKIYAMGADSGGVATTPSTDIDGTVNYGVSAPFSLTFDNFVSEFFFSEPYFRPDLSETQVISAKFKQSTNWTLTIRNSASTPVFTTTGSGVKATYTWDGKDSSGNSLPFDRYAYEITTDYVAIAAIEKGSVSVASGGSGSGGNGRPGTPNVGTAGTFGVAYQGHHPTFAEVGLWAKPTAGFSPVRFIPINYGAPFGPIKSVGSIASGFAKGAKTLSGFTAGSAFGASGVLGNDEITGSMLRSPTSIFNTVNIGLLIGHGVQADRPDLEAGTSGRIETYYPVHSTGGSSYDWVRMRDCQFGGNLKWMGVLACNILGDTAVNNWQPFSSWPFQPNQLHLLLSASTSVYMQRDFGTNWTWAMAGKLRGYPTKQSVRRSWFLAGYATQSIAGAYIIGKGGSPVQVDMRVIGSSNCIDELVSQNIAPNENIIIRTTTIYDPSSTVSPPS